jgi:hypothetical protein
MNRTYGDNTGNVVGHALLNRDAFDSVSAGTTHSTNAGSLQGVVARAAAAADAVSGWAARCSARDLHKSANSAGAGAAVHSGVIRRTPMDDILRFPSAVRHDPAIDRWLAAQRDDLRRFVEPWFARMRTCGGDVRELMHDGCPTACVSDAAFGYVNAFRDHVNVGFFFGALLSDPVGLLEGTGKRGRHVKLRPGREVDPAALAQLIDTAYADIRARLRT